MKYTKFFVPAAIAAAFVLGWWIRGPASPPEPAPVAQQGAQAEVWSCPMHPQIVRDGPARCPICGMDLEVRRATDDPGPRRLAMSEADVKLAEIATAPVERRFVTAPVRMVGKVDFDETRVRTISAWVPGRLDRLYVDYTGVPVREGDHLVSLYSPDMLTAQEELLEVKKAVEQGARQPSEFLRESDRRRLESARDKLRLWGLLPGQIREIEERGTAEDHVLINSPSSGIVIHKGQNEGDYVQTGTKIYVIADLDHLWVKLDAYESDLPWIRYGQQVRIETEAYPGELFDGWISFIDPVLDNRTRTVKVRVNVDNHDRRLKPGMFVRATVRSRIAQGGQVMDPRLAGKWICPMHPEVVEDGPGSCRVCGMPVVEAEQLGYVRADAAASKPLVVPASAVLVTGTRGVVYVEVPDAERPTYEGREVVLGPRAGDHYIVLAGVSEGERVVVNGNFKIDSALQIRAKPSMMSMPADPPPLQGKALGVFRTALAPLYRAYFEAQEALAADDRERAAAAFAALEAASAAVAADVPGRAAEAWDDVQHDLDESVRRSGAAQDIEGARAAFGVLARAMLELERTFGHAGDAVHVEVHCPMVPASWLQRAPEVRNPFYGASMLVCGEVRGSFPGRGGAAAPEQERRPPPAQREEPAAGEERREEAVKEPAKEPGEQTEEVADPLASVFAAYFDLQDHLASDRLDPARAAFTVLAAAASGVDEGALPADRRAAWRGLAERLLGAAGTGAAAADLAASRRAFRDVSGTVLAMERELGHAGGEHFEVFCPMAFGEGASWLQDAEDVRNPYYGASMLRCGSVKQRFAGREKGR